MATQNLIRITHWLAFVRTLGYRIPTEVTSRSLREAAADARIPAEMNGGVWYVRADHTDKIAAVLGLTRSKAVQHAA